MVDDSFENEYELIPAIPSQQVFCNIFSYAYDYHMAVAIFQQLCRDSIKFLDKGAAEDLNRLCVKDEEFVQMFQLISTMKGLGLRKDRVRFDIEFPTRNHLKVFLTKLIVKRRK